MIDAWDENMQLQWEMTRAVCFNIHAHSMADKKKKTPEKFWPFGWDKAPEKADSKRILEEHARMVAKRKALENNVNDGY